MRALHKTGLALYKGLLALYHTDCEERYIYWLRTCLRVDEAGDRAFCRETTCMEWVSHVLWGLRLGFQDCALAKRLLSAEHAGCIKCLFTSLWSASDGNVELALKTIFAFVRET